jgi:LacI family transcriptional regulator
MTVEGRGGGRRGEGAGQPVTLQLIAAELGVSTATVSLALRGSPAVAEATRERVRERARQLGYVYNRSAASLRTSRTHMIAVCVHDITNPYFAEMLGAIEEAALATGRTMLLGTYAEDHARQQRLLSTFREYRPDGVILCPAAGTTLDDMRVLTDIGAPIAQLSREIPDSGLDFVGSDDKAGVARALTHLIELGHRRIAFFGGVQCVSTGLNRHAAYRETLAAHGLPVDADLIFPGWGRREVGLQCVEKAFALKEPPTAALCFNDLVAFGAMMGLYRLGKTPGEDFSLVGYDDVTEASQWSPGLTSMRHEISPGKLAAEALLARIADPARPQMRNPIVPQLNRRGTTQPPKAKKTRG